MNATNFVFSKVSVNIKSFRTQIKTISSHRDQILDKTSV